MGEKPPKEEDCSKEAEPSLTLPFEKENEMAMFLIGLFMGAIFGFVAAVILEAGKLPDLLTGE